MVDPEPVASPGFPDLNVGLCHSTHTRFTDLWIGDVQLDRCCTETLISSPQGRPCKEG